MDKVLELIKTRRSIRKFKAEMPSSIDIEKIVEAGTYTATGMNRQSPIIIAVTNKDMRDKIAEANRLIGGWHEGFDPFYGAPAILIVLANKEMPTYLYDGSMVMANMMLEAHELGLGSCWIHRAKEEFEQAEWKEWLKSLGIEGDYEGIAHMALGHYEGDYPKVLPRKDKWAYFVK